MSSPSTQNTLMLVFGDGRTGHHLAMHMCQYNDEHKTFKQILVVVDKTFEKHMDEVKKCKTCKVVAVDLSKPHEHRQQMDPIMMMNKPNWLILLPTGDTMTPEAIKNTMDCYKNGGGQNALMHSLIMAEQASEEPTKNLAILEKTFYQNFPKTSCVLRWQMCLDTLDYFIEEFKEKKTWRLPLAEGKFCPIAMKDIGMATGIICTEEKLGNECIGKTFNLTNTMQLDGNRLAQMTSSALNQDVKYENCDYNEAQEHLRKFIRNDKASMDSMHRNLTSKAEVCGMMFTFKMIEANKFDQVTNDLKMIIKQEPTSIEEYLREHQNRFKSSM